MKALLSLAFAIFVALQIGICSEISCKEADDFIDSHSSKLVQDWCDFDAPPRRAFSSLSKDECAIAEVVFRRMHDDRFQSLKSRPRVLLTVFSDSVPDFFSLRLADVFPSQILKKQFDGFPDCWLRIDHLEILTGDRAFAIGGWSFAKIPGGASLFCFQKEDDIWKIAAERPLWIE